MTNQNRTNNNYVVGDTSWEYVYKPRGFKRFYKRPKIRYIHGFSYYFKGTEEIQVPKGVTSDGFSMPWPFVVASLLFLDFVMEHITWCSGVHDEVCKRKMFSRKKRVDVFRESLCVAFQWLKLRINEGDEPNIKKFYRKASAIVRNYLLVAGVRVGSSVFRAC